MALRLRLDPGSKTLAAQEFRHSVQEKEENVAEYMCENLQDCIRKKEAQQQNERCTSL